MPDLETVLCSYRTPKNVCQSRHCALKPRFLEAEYSVCSLEIPRFLEAEYSVCSLEIPRFLEAEYSVCSLEIPRFLEAEYSVCSLEINCACGKLACVRPEICCIELAVQVFLYWRMATVDQER